MNNFGKAGSILSLLKIARELIPKRYLVIVQLQKENLIAL